MVGISVFADRDLFRDQNISVHREAADPNLLRIERVNFFFHTAFNVNFKNTGRVGYAKIRTFNDRGIDRPIFNIEKDEHGHGAWVIVSAKENFALTGFEVVGGDVPSLGQHVIFRIEVDQIVPVDLQRRLDHAPFKGALHQQRFFVGGRIQQIERIEDFPAAENELSVSFRDGEKPTFGGSGAVFFCQCVVPVQKMIGCFALWQANDQGFKDGLNRFKASLLAFGRGFHAESPLQVFALEFRFRGLVINDIANCRGGRLFGCEAFDPIIEILIAKLKVKGPFGISGAALNGSKLTIRDCGGGQSFRALTFCPLCWVKKHFKGHVPLLWGVFKGSQR